MKKKLLIISGLVMFSLVLSGCGGGQEKNKPGEGGESSGNGPENQQEDKSREQSFKGTVKDLLEKGEPLKCNFTHSGENSEMSGVAYVDGEKARQDVSVNQDGQEMETHVIIKEKTVYTWGPMQEGKGMKMSLSELEKQQEQSEEKESEEESQTPESLEESFQYDCSAWSGDSSKFALPGGVEFMDMSEMMQGLQGMQDMQDNLPSSPGEMEDFDPGQMDQGNMENLNEQACEACSMAPNPEQCRVNLGCN